MYVVVLVGVFIIALAFTWFLRRYALAKSLMDVPNHRSSHTVPTPRGGGMAIVIVFLLSLIGLFASGQLDLNLALALVVGGGIVALVGFLDDHGHIAARWRLVSHFLAAAWVLYWLEGSLTLILPGVVIVAPWIMYILAAFFLVWMLNLYNFMDGIDGIASVEAISVCVGGALIYWLLGSFEQVLILLVLAAAVGGFLVWNFPPAKIFMGDAGSGFLGLILGSLAISAMLTEPNLLWSWLILLGVFIFDATWTLIRRLLRGEKVYEAHRSHAYQSASRVFGAHLSVTLAVLCINVGWLLPWAIIVALGHINGLLGLIVAYLPLAVLSLRFNAGAAEGRA